MLLITPHKVFRPKHVHGAIVGLPPGMLHCQRAYLPSEFYKFAACETGAPNSSDQARSGVGSHPAPSLSKAAERLHVVGANERKVIEGRADPSARFSPSRSHLQEELQRGITATLLK
jgi:hypothetical protein